MDLILMNIGGSNEIKGESTITGHESEIEVMSFSHNVSLPMQINPSTNGRTVGRSQHGDFVISKQVDIATPKLNLYCCNGDNVATIIIVCVRNDGTGGVLPIITYTLTNAIVSSVSVSGGAGGSPVETVTFNYSKIAWKVQSQKEDNVQEDMTETLWNLETNTNT